jgi:hypothetical protein
MNDTFSPDLHFHNFERLPDGRLSPRIIPLYGFNETEFGKKHDLLKEWTTFTKNDCVPFVEESPPK